jgi:hypothetical protein
LLESAGVEESHFRMFAEGEPLDENEHEPLLRVLYALRKCPLSEIDRLAHDTFRSSASDAYELRGEIFRMRGRVTHVTVERPLVEVANRYEMKQYYRCQVLLDAAKPLTVLALAVPKQWPLDREFSERVSCLGLYLKQAPAEDEAELQSVFATQRLAWHPAGLLGDLGMDVGLFDQVQNKAPMGPEERECFYQLLAAAGKADPQELFRLTERAAQDDDSVVPLFNEPDQQHGRLVALRGTARRALLVKLDPKRDADIIARFGLDHYYQVEMFTEDSQGNPLVFCVREIPPEWTEQGPDLYETVRIAGFFFKSWAYRLQPRDEQSAPGHQLAPMLIGNQIRWLRLESARNPLAGAIGGGLFLVVLAGLFLAVWLYHRGDRKFRQQQPALTVFGYYRPKEPS